VAQKARATDVSKFPKTFSISKDRKSITCKCCKLTSYDLNDVTMRYCGHCLVYHDDIFPPARAFWIANSGQYERTCVHCGCTDSNACLGGCSWVEIHKATPTGVCSTCAAPRASMTPSRLQGRNGPKKLKGKK